MDQLALFFGDHQELAAPSRENYRQVLNELSRYCGGKDWAQITEAEVKAYLALIENPNTWNNHFGKIRKFYRWMGKVDFLSKCKHKKHVQRVDFLNVNQTHVAWMVDVANTLRDKAMLAVLFECGFRRGELAAIKLGNVKFDQYGVLITCPKGKTGPRPVRGIECAALLSQWIESHPLKDHVNAPLFCATRNQSAHVRLVGRVGYARTEKQEKAVNLGDPLDAGTIAKIVKRCWATVIARHPEVQGIRVYTHIGRHFSATKAAGSGKMNTQALKLRFGWKTNAMPDVYCHLTGADADQQYLAANGIVQEDTASKPMTCPRCHFGNVTGTDYCGRCGSPLTLAIAQKLEEKKTGFEEMEKDPEVLAEITKRLKADVLKQLASDPEILKALLAATKSP